MEPGPGLALPVLQHHVRRLRREHQQVFWSQVVAIAVAVVHHLSISERAAQQALSFKAMNVLQFPSLGMPATWVPALLGLTANNLPGDDSGKLRTIPRPCRAEEGRGRVGQAFQVWSTPAVRCPLLIVGSNQRLTEMPCRVPGREVFTGTVGEVSLGAMVLQFYAAICLLGLLRDRFSGRIAFKGFPGDPRHRDLNDLKRDVAGHFPIGHQRFQVAL